MPEQMMTVPALRAAFSHGNGLLEKLLDALPQEVTDRLLAQATLRDVAATETVLERGMRSKDVGYVLDGTLAMVQVLEDGKKHIVGLLVPTDIYGRLFDGPSNYRIEALSAARILSFPRAFFEEVLRDNPKAERLFLVHLLDEVDAAREWLLLTILVRRLKFKQTGGPAVVHVPIARKDMAQYLGSRPETLSRAFHELETRGILRIVDPYHFEIVDEEALIDASGDDLTFQDN